MAKGGTYRHLDEMARDLVGDGRGPNIFFVSGKDGVILVTTDFDMAYAAWSQLPRDQESNLEDRKHGLLATTGSGNVSQPRSQRGGSIRVRGHRREVR